MNRLITLILTSLICETGFTQTNTFPSSGNVGIGTTSPSKQLHLYGPDLVEAHIETTNNGYANLNLQSNGKFWHLSKRPSSEGDAFQIYHYNGSSWVVPAMITFLPNTNIGIGTANPLTKLDINSPDNDGATKLRIANTTASGINNAGSCPAIEILGARGDGNTTFSGRLALGTRRTDGTALSNQKLGIVLFGGQYGTDNSFQSSKILYPASIQGTAEGSFTNASTMPTGIAFYTGSTGDDVGSVNLNYGTERMRIASNGNVGIGTANPQALLSVNGEIYSKKVKVTQSGWSDYVFEFGYKLPILSEVEKYIQTHKHLSEIPSAAEVEKDGLNLGDNQALLLKKIEELTLYLIEQNKKMEKQNHRLMEQDKKINDLIHIINKKSK